MKARLFAAECGARVGALATRGRERPSRLALGGPTLDHTLQLPGRVAARIAWLSCVRRSGRAQTNQTKDARPRGARTGDADGTRHSAPPPSRAVCPSWTLHTFGSDSFYQHHSRARVHVFIHDWGHRHRVGPYLQLQHATVHAHEYSCVRRRSSLGWCLVRMLVRCAAIADTYRRTLLLWMESLFSLSFPPPEGSRSSGSLRSQSHLTSYQRSNQRVVLEARSPVAQGSRCPARSEADKKHAIRC